MNYYYQFWNVSVKEPVHATIIDEHHGFLNPVVVPSRNRGHGIENVR